LERREVGERLEEAYIKVVARCERWDGREVEGAEGLDEDTGEDIPQPNNPMACTRLFARSSSIS
jgi:hypothetical protein